MNLRNLFVITTSLCALNTYAGTSLPYIGPKAKLCNVQKPADFSENDSGYIPSEDCNIIYVLPPVQGAMKYSTITEMREIAYCPIVNGILSKITEYQDKIPFASVLESKKLIEDINSLDQELDQLARDKVISTVSGSAQLEWGRLIDSYKKSNPTKDVKKIPIAFGVLTAKIYKKNKYDQLSVSNGVVGLDVYGLGLPEDYEGIQNSPVPDYLKKLTQNEEYANVLMGEGVGFSLFLDLRGACTFKKDSKFAMSGTYTYFYPVQDNTLLKVRWDDDLLGKLILNLAKEKHGRVSTEELFQAINGNTKIISIETNTGAFGSGNDVEKLEREYKDDLIKLALESILSVVSNSMDSIVKLSQYNETESRIERNCKKTWYGRNKCNNNYYTIVTTKINWDSVRVQLKSLIQGKNEDAEVSGYKTFYVTGSSAIVPIKGIGGQK